MLGVSSHKRLPSLAANLAAKGELVRPLRGARDA